MRLWSPRECECSTMRHRGRSPPHFEFPRVPRSNSRYFWKHSGAGDGEFEGCHRRHSTASGPRLQPQHPLRIRSPTSILSTYVHGTHLWINLIGQTPRGCDQRGTSSAFGRPGRTAGCLPDYVHVLSHRTAMEKKTFVQSTLHGNGKDVSTEQHSWCLARNRLHIPPGRHDVTVSDAQSLSISSHFPIPIHPSSSHPGTCA